MKGAAWMALALLAPAAAGELPLQLAGEGAYFTLRVPLHVRAQARWPGLEDLRVLNAAGQAVPHAWVEDETGLAARPKRQGVPLFKAPPAAASAPAPQGEWIVDLRAVQGTPQELQLDLAPGTNGVFPFVLETSADLQQWRTLLPAAQLVALQHQGLRLDHGPFELGQGTSGGYLRLRPPRDHPLPPLAAARVTSLVHATAHGDLALAPPPPGARSPESLAPEGRGVVATAAA